MKMKVLGEKFCTELQDILSKCTFCRSRTQHCYRHGVQCPVSYEEPAGEAPHVIAVAGVTCTDFSSFGKRRGISGASMVVFFAWLHQILADEPDLILIECVTSFVVAILMALRVKYDLQFLDFSPLDMGIPAARLRKYMLLTRKSYVKVDRVGEKSWYWNFERLLSQLASLSVLLVTLVEVVVGLGRRPGPTTTATTVARRTDNDSDWDKRLSKFHHRCFLTNTVSLSLVGYPQLA